MPDLATARAFTIDLARFTAAETIKDVGRAVGDHCIDIEDENGTVLDNVHFRAAIKLKGETRRVPLWPS